MPQKSKKVDDNLHLNRELQWLRFNERVLGESEISTNPILERIKFLSIFYSNLDEFFMVRLSGLLKLWKKNDSNSNELETDADETLDEVSLKVREYLRRAERNVNSHLLPKLAEAGVGICSFLDLTEEDLEFLSSYFDEQIFPVLTPLAVDPAHPFPYLNNLSIYLAVTFRETESSGHPLLAFVEVPPKLHRFVALPHGHLKKRYLPIESVISMHLSRLFPWTESVSAHAFRVTRNLDYQLMEGEVKDLMKSIEFELKDRAQKIVVRLEVESGMSESLKNRLRHALELDPSDVYEIHSILNLRDFFFLTKLDLPLDLRETPFNPRIHPRLADGRIIFDVIKEGDVLLHHPFHSFISVLDFLRAAATDPNVLAIKQTLYRTGGDSPIIEALMSAAEKGKQVTAVVELKARFDEHNNIAWARQLERAGAHVVYGYVGLKTHAKCAIVVRKEGEDLRNLTRYVHLSTGNYNTSTSKMYTDVGHLTADPVIANDVTRLFNMLTGFNIARNDSEAPLIKRLPEFKKIAVSPFSLRARFIELIESEWKTPQSDSQHKPRVILKMNSLVDPQLIQTLYVASQKGVQVDLIVRGVCTLRPGLKSLSENIRVVSLIDRFLEHSRIFWFSSGGRPQVFLGSADFMPRNLDRRIEVVWPIENEDLKKQVFEILETILQDNCKTHIMLPDGTYERPPANSRSRLFRAQEAFISLARKQGVKTIAYDDAVKYWRVP